MAKKNHRTIKEAAKGDLEDLATLSASSVDKLCALFDAIYRATPENSHERELASIGSYLADDWSHMITKELEGMLERY